MFLHCNDVSAMINGADLTQKLPWKTVGKECLFQCISAINFPKLG